LDLSLACASGAERESVGPKGDWGKIGQRPYPFLCQKEHI